MICDLGKCFEFWWNGVVVDGFGESAKRPAQFSGPVLVEFNRVVQLVLYNLYYYIQFKEIRIYSIQ